MRWFAYCIVAAALFGAGFGSGYFWALDTGNSASQSVECLDVSGTRLQKPDFDSSIIEWKAFPCIVGIIQNKCQKKIEFRVFDLQPFDSSGFQIGDARVTPIAASLSSRT